jgi:hypothetical protein
MSLEQEHRHPRPVWGRANAHASGSVLKIIDQDGIQFSTCDLHGGVVLIDCCKLPNSRIRRRSAECTAIRSCTLMRCARAHKTVELPLGQLMIEP